jgi:hypothetical protein
MKINFLIADEVRPEASGKQTILGLYPDQTIVIEEIQALGTDIEELPVAIDRLNILINISDISAGEHELKGQIVEPSGAPHGDKIDFGKISIEKGLSRSFVLALKPFIIKEMGTYNFNLYVDDELHQFSFNIIDKQSK